MKIPQSRKVKAEKVAIANEPQKMIIK